MDDLNKPTGTDVTAGTKQPDGITGADAPKTVSQEEFKALIRRIEQQDKHLKRYQTEEAERKAKDQEREQAEALKRGEHEKVIEQIRLEKESIAKRLAEYEAKETARIDALKAKLAEKLKTAPQSIKDKIAKAEAAGIEFQLELADDLLQVNKPVPGMPTYPGRIANQSNDDVIASALNKPVRDATLSLIQNLKGVKR